jgi:hypothetical protein
MYCIILILIAFLVGLYVYGNFGTPKLMEGLTNNNGQTRCPDVLVQKGIKYYLYNSKIAKVPGVNPIEFQNLEEYVEFLDWQRSQGIRCPVLYLQHSYDTQGNAEYKIRPSATDLQGGLPPSVTTNAIPYINPNPTLLMDAARNDPPYNQNTAPGYDQSSQYVGATTPLDIMNQQEENLLFNPNAMDDNWAGQEYTQALVDQGYYKGNEVNINVA